jgi:hypothetical protein
MAVALLNLLVARALDSLLVGTTFFALGLRFGWRTPRRRAFLALVAAFAALDCLYLPALSVLDITFTVRNEAAAAALGLSANQPAFELALPSPVSLVLWSAQAILAALAGEAILRGGPRGRAFRK